MPAINHIVRNLYQLILSGFLISLTILGQPVDILASDLKAVRILSPLEIDGALNEDLYLKDSFSYFIQEEPDNGIPATEKTEVWVGYDDNALYIGARLWDNHPDSITARMGRRDSEFNSDDFEVAIDSYHDRRSGFFFIINPLGAIVDGTIDNDSRGYHSHNCVSTSVTK